MTPSALLSVTVLELELHKRPAGTPGVVAPGAIAEAESVTKTRTPPGFPAELRHELRFWKVVCIVWIPLWVRGKL